mgnify:CR=1 FL=1
MTIYLDVVIVENLIMDAIIIYATAIVLKVKIRHLRIIISSLIGAIYSVLSYISDLEIYNNLFLKIFLSIVMVYIAFSPQNIKTLMKQILIFYLTSFLFGGVAFALIYVIKPQEILMKNGLFLGMYPLKTVFLGAIVATAILITAFKVVKSNITKKDMMCNVSIELNNKTVNIKTMIDTGNMLKEPISGLPVIVVENTALYELIPKEILDNLDDILGGDFQKIPDNIKSTYIAKLKWIPYSSLGKQNGMLVGIKADKVIVEKDDQIIEHNNVIIGIYNKSLTKRGEYRGLIGVELLSW